LISAGRDCEIGRPGCASSLHRQLLSGVAAGLVYQITLHIIRSHVVRPGCLVNFDSFCSKDTTRFHPRGTKTEGRRNATLYIATKETGSKQIMQNSFNSIECLAHVGIAYSRVISHRVAHENEDPPDERTPFGIRSFHGCASCVQSAS
jgi:hypothetical protein